MRTNTSIPYILSGKEVCVRHVLDEYRSLTAGHQVDYDVRAEKSDTDCRCESPHMKCLKYQAASD